METESSVPAKAPQDEAVLSTAVDTSPCLDSPGLPSRSDEVVCVRTFLMVFWRSCAARLSPAIGRRVYNLLVDHLEKQMVAVRNEANKRLENASELSKFEMRALKGKVACTWPIYIRHCTVPV